MKLWRRIQYLIRSRQHEADLAEELAFHQAAKRNAYEASGMSEQEAGYAASRALGNLTQIKEDSRQIWLTRQIETLAQDIRYGGRTLINNPGFTVIAVLALTLGIGLNTILFTAFNAIVVAPFNVRDPSTVVGLFRAPNPSDRRPHYSGFSYTSIEYLQGHSKKLSGIAATMSARPTAVNDTAMVRAGYFVTGNYLSMLRADMELGRFFLPEEDARGNGKPVVVLSHSLWQRLFAGDRSVVGRNIRLNYHDFLVVGVTAPGFSGTSPTAADFWVPMNAMKFVDPSRDAMDFNDQFCCVEAFGRLAPGVSRNEAAAELTVLLDQYGKSINVDEQHAVYVSRATFASTPDRQAVVFPVFGLMLSAVTLVLLIACANIANLLLARATARQREIGIRLSIGASRLRLIRQLLTESILLALAGSALALLIASNATAPLMERFSDERLSFNFSPDFRVFAATAIIAAVASLAFGLVPALHATRANLNSALHAGSVFTGRFTTSRLRSILLGAQVAFSLVLLVGAGLLTRSLQHAESIDPGFAVADVAVLSPDLRLHNYKEDTSAAFWRELQIRVAALPGVRSVAHAFVPPLGSMRALTGGLIDGKKTGSGKDSLATFSANWVSTNYLRTLGIPIVLGRDFRESDKKAMIINETMAAKFWPDINPIGHYLYTGKDNKEQFEVVGVAKTVRSVNLSSPDEPYAYLLTEGGPDQRLFVRTGGDPRISQSILPKMASSLDPQVRSTVSMLSENLKMQIDRQKTVAGIAAALGMVALALACIGIYGVVAYTVQQRTREIGVRMALGANKSQVLLAVMKQNLRVIAIGTATGLAAAAAVSRVITSYLYGLSPLDPISFGAVLIALLASAMIASYVPARRAVTVDPSTALRHE